MRVFIAIDIDEKIRTRIAKVQADLRQGCPPKLAGIKWVNPDLIHLTIKFLGEISDPHALDVCKIVADTCENHRCFDINVSGLGTFGKPARVLWLAVQNSPELLNLQQNLDGELEKDGFQAEKRRFSGHLTLARIKSSAAAKIISTPLQDMKNTNLGNFHADSVNIYKSELTSTAPVYTLIHKVVLKP